MRLFDCLWCDDLVTGPCGGSSCELRELLQPVRPLDDAGRDGADRLAPVPASVLTFHHASEIA